MLTSRALAIPTHNSTLPVMRPLTTAERVNLLTPAFAAACSIVVPRSAQAVRRR
jgi:hypothetical protein